MRFFAGKHPVKLAAAAVAAVLTLVAIVLVYGQTYPLKNDKDVLSQVINDFLSVRRPLSGRSIDYRPDEVIDIYVLETIRVRRGLAAFFKIRDDRRIFGFALFERGFNMRYGMSGFTIAPIPYSAVIIARTFDHDNIMVGAYNAAGIHSFGIQFAGDRWIEIDEDEWQREFVVEAMFPAKGEQFFFIIPINEVYEQAGFSAEEIRQIRQILPAGRLYDEAGNDISNYYYIQGIDSGWRSGGSSAVSVNVFLIVAVFIFGGAIVRSLLKEGPQQGEQTE